MNFLWPPDEVRVADINRYFCKSLKSYHQSFTSDEKPTTNEGEEHYKPKILSETSSTVLFSLTEHDMAVEHRLPLLLDLPPPPLLSVLHFVKHAGSRVRPGQNIVSIGKRLLVLKTQRRQKNR